MSNKVHHVGNLNGWDVVVWYEKRPNKNYSSASLHATIIVLRQVLWLDYQTAIALDKTRQKNI